jgi:hypothetical protein
MEMANKLVLQVRAQSFVQGSVVSKMHFWSIRYRPIFFATSSFHLCVGRWWQGVVVLLITQASLSTPWKTSLCCKWWHNHLCEGEVFGFQYHLQVVNCLKHQLQTKLYYKLVSPSFWVTMTTDCGVTCNTSSFAIFLKNELVLQVIAQSVVWWKLVGWHALFDWTQNAI